VSELNVDSEEHTIAKHISNMKVKDSRNRPGMTQRVTGGLGSQISLIFGT
jgi:hypothetical protein